MSAVQVRKSSRQGFRTRLLLGASTAIPLAAIAMPSYAQAIQQQSAGNITVDAASASGTPIAVELSSTGGAVNATVTTVTGTAGNGVRDYVVGLETLTDGAIVGQFGTITGTGTGELLGLGAESFDGDITLSVDAVDVDGVSSAGIAALSTSGDISISANSVLSRGTGMDSQQEYFEAVFGSSQNGSVTIDVGSAETYGQYGSAIVGLAGGTVDITADSATFHSEQTVGVYASAAGDIAVGVGTVSSSATGGQGVYINSSGGNATLAVDTVDLGSDAEAARVLASGNVDVTIGDVAAGGGLTARSTGGDTTVTVTGDIVGETYGGMEATGANVVVTMEEGSSITAAGLTWNGIYASGSESIQVTATDVHTNGTAINAVASGNATIVIDAANVSNEADDYAAINATSVAGDIAISGGSVSTAGHGSIGVFAQSTDGDVSVAMDSVATTGLEAGATWSSEGIYAESFNGTASVSVGSAHVEGFAASAAIALGGAGATLSADEASSAGQQAAVLYAGSLNGDATVDAGTVTLRGQQQAAAQAIADQGVATIFVENVVNEGTLAGGVFARGAMGASVTTGTIEADRYGVYANAAQGGVNIAATGDTTVSTGYGLRGIGASVSISTAADTTTQADGNAIWAQSTGPVTIENQGTARTTGLGSAIFAESDGSVTITSANAEAVGAGVDPGAGADNMRIPQGGIVAYAGGTISIDAGTVSVEGEHRYGIYAFGTGGTNIEAGDVQLASADSVAVAGKSDAGMVSITTGTVVTTGASGVGVFADTGSGDITIDAGTTRVENEGIAGQFTGDAIVATSDTGNIAITSADAYSAALYGSAVVGLSAGDVSIVSERAETTGDGGVAVYASSSGAGGMVSVDSEAVFTSGASTAAVTAIAQSGTANVRVGDITASADDALGLTARSVNTSVQIDGDVSAGGLAVNAVGFQTLEVDVNGSVTSANGAGVSALGQHAVVTIAEGASINAATAGLAVGSILQPDPAFIEVYNQGTVQGSTAVYVNVLQNTAPANVVILNDGTLIGTSGYSVVTAGGDDVLELTENSQVTGIADLGDGFDILALGFNDGVTEGVGQVASTMNVEHLSVSSGSWLTEGPQSYYDSVAIDEGSMLTVGEDADGYIAISTPYVALNGTLALDLASDTEAGDLSGLLIEGEGQLRLVGGATVLVDDASGLQHTGGTFVDNGVLLLTDLYGGDITTTADGTFQLGDGGVTGDYTGDLVNDGTFVFARSDDYTLTGGFSGSGLLEKQGDGTLTFGGVYDFVGTTSVLGGSIALTGMLDESAELDLEGEGSFDLSQVAGGEQTISQLSGTGGNLVLGGTNLTVNQSGNTSFAGTLSGTGTLTKQGEGDLKLEGDSSFSGSAAVNGGTLSVNGSFAAASFFVNEGGKLGGSGTVGTTSIQGGTLGAGNSIGTLTVNGDLTFTSSSVLEVEVDAAGNADLIQVTGLATLGGATVDVLAGAGTYAPSTDYTILTSEGGIDGTFDTVTTNLAFLVPLLSYTVDTVTLNLSRNDIAFADYGETENQGAIGGLVEDLGFGSPLYMEALQLGANSVADDFETLTGEIYPAFSASMVETAEMIRRQTAHDAGGASGTYVWGTGLLGSIDGEGGSGIDYSVDHTGVAAGLGFGFAGLELSAGAGKLWQDPDNGQVTDSDVTFALVEAAWSSPVGLSVRGGAQFGWVGGDASRSTRLGTISGTVNGDLDGDYTVLFGEVGFGMGLPGITIEPYVGISRISLDIDDVTETGPATALEVTDLDRDVTFGSLGIRLGVDTPLGLAPYASAAYRRAWGDRTSDATVAFAGNASGATIGALPIARSAAELEAGLRYTSGNWGLEAGYAGTLSDTFDSHGFTVTASIRF